MVTRNRKVIGGGERGPGVLVAQEKLLRKLLRGEFENGQPLKESVLAAEFDVSRPSVREALCQAIGWGVVEYVPYCGYRIRSFTLRDLLNWHELREAIEPIAARNFAELDSPEAVATLKRCLEEEEETAPCRDLKRAWEADLKFHMSIVNNCGNSRFSSPALLCYFFVLFKVNLEMLQKLDREVPSLTYSAEQAAPGKEEYFENQVEGRGRHREIFEAIRSGRADRARTLLWEHVNGQVLRMRKIVDYFGDAEISLAELTAPRSRRKKQRDLLDIAYGRDE